MSSKNMAASVHARLAQIARRTGRPFQELLQYYAMERFLYRLSKSPHAARFVLKGALMLRVWDAPMARPTKDIDLLGRLENSLENLSTVVREVCALGVEPDGLVFRPTTVKSERITEDADYEGVRTRFDGLLARAMPAKWRRRRLRVPDGVVLHHADVPKRDRAWVGAVPVTSAARTLVDCAADHVAPDFLSSAASQALARGMVSRPQATAVERAAAAGLGA